MSSNTYSCIDLQNAEIINSKTEWISVSHTVSPFFVLTLNYCLMVQFIGGPLKLQQIVLKCQNYAEIGRPHAEDTVALLSKF